MDEQIMRQPQSLQIKYTLNAPIRVDYIIADSKNDMNRKKMFNLDSPSPNVSHHVAEGL